MAKIKYEIRNERKGKSYRAIEENNSWLNDRISDNTFGKPAREIKLENADEFELPREESRRTETDEEGNETIFISVPADYIIVETDVTVEEDAKEAEQAEKKAAKVAAIIELKKLDIKDKTKKMKADEMSDAIKQILEHLGL